MDVLARDQNGDPILVGSFVRVRRETSLGVTEFRGTVLRGEETG
jgi:hypothetical protein